MNIISKVMNYIQEAVITILCGIIERVILVIAVLILFVICLISPKLAYKRIIAMAQVIRT